MKKIAILTYHACFNYGACLQAYALQQVVMKKYPDCEIIDYQSDLLRNISNVFSKYPSHPKEIIKNVTRLPYYKQLIIRQSLFESFINNDLKLSKLCKTEKDVVDIADKYECIICGSDQTWNLDSSIRYENPVYYLNFDKKQKRISYATSFGSWVDHFPERENELLPWLKLFDHLSMREESGVNMLRSKGLDCEWVLDPTLLLGQDEYNFICKERLIDEPYVLLFSWNGAREAIQIAKMVSEKMRCKVFYIVPPPRAMFCGIERKLDVGPKEFLSLIKHASFVVTNSFHGTVFSAIYNKPFVSAISDFIDPRRASLMKQLGLQDHLMSPNTLDIEKIFKTDFSIVDNNIRRLKERSLDYLYNSLNEE